MAENQVIDFNEMTNEQKKNLMINGILKASNFSMFLHYGFDCYKNARL